MTLGKLDELQTSAHRWLDTWLGLRQQAKGYTKNLRKLLNLERIEGSMLKTKSHELLRTRLRENLQQRHDLRDHSGFQVQPLGLNLRALVDKRQTQRESLLNLQCQALGSPTSGAKSPQTVGLL